MCVIFPDDIKDFLAAAQNTFSVSFFRKISFLFHHEMNVKNRVGMRRRRRQLTLRKQYETRAYKKNPRLRSILDEIEIGNKRREILGRLQLSCHRYLLLHNRTSSLYLNLFNSSTFTQPPTHIIHISHRYIYFFFRVFDTHLWYIYHVNILKHHQQSNESKPSSNQRPTTRQCRWKFRGDSRHKGNNLPWRTCRMETACHL